MFVPTGEEKAPLSPLKTSGFNNSEKEILIDRFFQVNRYSIRSYSSAYLDMGVLRKSYIPRTGR